MRKEKAIVREREKREIITVGKLRNLFFNFAKGRGYRIIEADSLISDAFPTTFTVSGGPNFADEFLDTHGGKFKGNSAVTQHCVRHWDYENVGDGRHLSFFEMAVVSCFDGYSREQMMRDIFGFLTDVIRMPQERFWVTIFGGGFVRGKKFEPDDEMWYIWESLGISSDQRILIPQDIPREFTTFPGQTSDAIAREAFIANAVEPVGGPRSEIFFETDKTPECKPRCLPGFCKCGRYIEFFTTAHYTHFVTPVSHERDRFGEMRLRFEPIENYQIFAAGFGLERVTQIMNDLETIYEVDTVKPIVKVLLEGLKNKGTDISNPTILKSAVVVAEHIRGIVFLIAEGVLELRGGRNRSRKYVYRRYLRNMFLHMNNLQITAHDENISKMIDTVIEIYGDVYPHILNCRRKVIDEIERRWDKYMGRRG